MINKDATYTQRIEIHNKLAYASKEKAEKLRKSLLTNSFLRLIVFLIIAVVAYFMFVKSIWFAVALLGAIIVFLLLLRRHTRLSTEKSRAETTLNSRRRTKSVSTRFFTVRRNSGTHKSVSRFQFRFGYFWKRLNNTNSQPRFVENR